MTILIKEGENQRVQLHLQDQHLNQRNIPEEGEETPIHGIPVIAVILIKKQLAQL